MKMLVGLAATNALLPRPLLKDGALSRYVSGRALKIGPPPVVLRHGKNILVQFLKAIRLVLHIID